MKDFFKHLLLWWIGGVIFVGFFGGFLLTDSPEWRDDTCGRFTVFELVVPAVPLACLLSTKIYP